jgi:[ribosomal protein S18]-alanine N-acetyltransferase
MARYPGPYAFYDTSVWPLATIMLVQTALRLVMRPIYYTVLNERGEIAGIFSFIRHERDIIEIGLGMRPDLTGQGQGLGLVFVLAGLDFARRHFRPKRFILSVATFNKRAMRTYERAGFAADRVVMRTKLGKPYEALEMWRVA